MKPFLGMDRGNFGQGTRVIEDLFALFDFDKNENLMIEVY